MEGTLCPWETSFWLFSTNVPLLLYYSHIPAIVVALLIGVYVFAKNRQSAIAKLLFSILVLFSIWAIIDIFLWANNRADLVIFGWSMQVLLEPIIYIVAFYLLFLFTFSRYPSFKLNFTIGVITLPLILLTPTANNLIGVNLYDCVAWEGPLALYYTYLIEGLSVAGILSIAFFGMRKFTERAEKVKILYFTLGLIAFLVAFTSGNLIGSFTGDWDLAQYGLFGMPVFIGLLAYLIVQYKVFNLKVFGAQVLVLALWILIASLLLVVQSNTSRIVALVTLVLALGFGFMLVRSVRREVSLREQLQTANEGQKNLIHIINHQIKGYLAKSRNIFSELLTEPTYGACTNEAKPMLQEGFNSLTEGVNFVTDFLTASNIDKGTFVYDMKPIDFKKIVTEVIEKQKEVAGEKGLSLDLAIARGDYNMKGDVGQLGQAVRNLIDNSIKYTPKGNVKVQMANDKGKILLTIQDTGVGISEELKPKLFTKGGRDADSIKINVNSTGFGLSFVKGVVEAHRGRVWADSPGPNQGSTFYMELPIS